VNKAKGITLTHLGRTNVQMILRSFHFTLLTELNKTFMRIKFEFAKEASCFLFIREI